MTPELKQKWIEALRSGRYYQVAGSLRANRDDGRYGYCCLGVLCDIYDSTQWNGLTGQRWGTPMTREDVYPKASSCGDLCNEHLNMFGLSTKNECDLISLNDQGSSFSEIADHIEKYVNDVG